MKITVPDFQRGIVWGLDDRQKLVDSIFSGYPIGSLLLFKRGNSDDQIQYSLIDGLQRSTTLRIYAESPASHFRNDWLNQKQWFLNLAEALSERGTTLSEAQEKLTSWAQNLPSISSARTSQLQSMLVDSGMVSLEEVMALNVLLDAFCDGIGSDYSIDDYIVPTVVYSGDSDNLSEIFSRINKQGRKLTRLQIIAANWHDCSVQLDMTNTLEAKIAKRVRERFFAFESQGYEIEDFDRDDSSTYCDNLFQYLFGLGKILVDDSEGLFEPSSETDPDTLAFYLLGISKELSVSELETLPVTLGDSPDLSKFSAACSDAVGIVSGAFRWITNLKLNRTSSKLFIPHSTNQMISIIGRVLIEKYNPADWSVRSTWDEQRPGLMSGIKSHYLLDIIRNYWAGSGDSKMFKRCWATTEGGALVRDPTYLNSPDVDSASDALQAWYSEQMQGKQKKRAAPNAAQKTVLKYIYSRLITVAENEEESYEIEHINSVRHMKSRIAETNSGGWPMNSIGNLMILQRETNRAKGASSVKEYLAGEPERESFDEVERLLITGVFDIPDFSELDDRTYRNYCDSRWISLKRTLLTSMGHTMSENRASTIAQGLSSPVTHLGIQLSPSWSAVNPDSSFIPALELDPIAPVPGPGSGTPKTGAEVTFAISNLIAEHLGVSFRREQTAKFIAEDGSTSVCVLVSKLHDSRKYWFGMFDHQVDWFGSQSTDVKYYALSSDDSENVFLIPLQILQNASEKFSYRYLDSRGYGYWHLNLKQRGDDWFLMTRKEYDEICVTEYKL